MRVLIVGKTRMRNDIVCVGGWDIDNNCSLRLLTSTGHNHPINTPYELGDIWEIECRRRQHIDPPHVEDVLVARSRHIGRHPGFPGVIDGLPNVHVGRIEGLYEGLLQFPGNGTGFISRQTGIPAFSTQFWRTDADLIRNDFGTKVRYRYEGRNVRNVTYVGF